MRFAQCYLALGVIGLLLITSPRVQAAEHCAELFDTQYGKAWGCASSVLPSQQGISYGPKALADSDEHTAWVEGAKGTGAGQWVELRYALTQHIKTIYITNGYTKNAETFHNNGRVKQARLTTDDGLNYTITLKDSTASQAISLPRWVDTKHLRLTIESTYPGKKYTDTALSEFMADLEEADSLNSAD